MTVSSALMLVAALGLGLALLLIGGAALLEFSWWALRMLWVLSFRFKDFLSRFLIQSIGFVCRVSVRAAAASLRFLFELATTLALLALLPPLRRLGVAVQHLRERMVAARRNILQPSVPETHSAPVVVQPEQEGRSDGKRPLPVSVLPVPVEDDEYRLALEMMGFDSGEGITSVDLKLRYSDMMKRVHPDHGFPNKVFAVQVSRARDTIKHVRGWT